MRRALVVQGVVALVLVALTAASSRAAERPAPRTPSALPPGTMLSAMTGGNTYGAELREANPRADGRRHIDTPGLVAKLTALKVNTYTYGIWNSPSDWDDLRLEFLPAAQRAGIEVMGYIVPPSECFTNGGRCSRPYTTDYVAWARAFAQLSLQYPNLTSWAIDDFDCCGNQDVYTVGYLTQIRDAFKVINPNLRFYGTIYYDSTTSPAFLDKYGPFVNGFIYPYLEGPWNNTADPNAVPEFLDRILAYVNPRRLELILLVYCNRFLAATHPPDEVYVQTAVRHGMNYARAGRIKGIIAYGVSVDGKPGVASENRAMYGQGRLSINLPENVPTRAGWWSSASQTVAVNPTAPRHELSFWHYDHYAYTPQLVGYHVKQVLIDDQVIWSSDIMDGPMDTWLQGFSWQGPIDVTSRLRGKSSAKLEFRVYEQAGVSFFPMDVGFDNIETIGFTVRNPGFEARGDWFLNGNNYPMNATVDVWYPDRPQRIFAAVAAEYGIT